MNRPPACRWLLGVATVSVAAVAAAGQPAARPENPLAGLPGRPGPHTEKIQAMGDNQWLNLGQAAADRKWGLARDRSWTPKMAYAPDLGGAFFCGTGQHGYVKSDGHYMDDLWFYDATAHRWICLYPGADTKSLEFRLDEHDFEVDRRGDFVPVSYLSHGYNHVTYNTHTRQFMLVFTYCPWWTKVLPQRAKWIGSDPKNPWDTGKLNASVRHPVFWDVAAGKWERAFVAGGGPGGKYMGGRFEGVVEYIPSLKKTVYTHRGKTWFYDHAARRWTAGPAVPASVSRYNSNGCYDPRRHRIYVAKGRGFAYLDIKNNRWHEPHAKGQPADLRAGNRAQVFFDVANGVVVWHESHGPVAVYDPDANRWAVQDSTFPKIPWKSYKPKYMCFSGFYHAALNVHFFYLAGDSITSDATMLAYRYKSAKK